MLRTDLWALRRAGLGLGSSAGDDDLAEFFRRAQGESRKGAEQGKEQLRKRLAA